MEKIFFTFGTSDTVGFWDWEGGGWADRLKRYLMSRTEKNRDDYFALYNLGIDGDTTTGILKRIENEIPPRLWPGVEAAVIFDCGGNDAILINDKEPKTPMDEFTKNIRSLIQVARKYTQTIIFLDTAPIDEGKTTPASWDESVFCRSADAEKYYDAIKEIVHEEGTLFVAMYEEFQKMNGEHLSFDGLHLNPKGHEKQFELVRDFLVEHKII